MYEYNLGIRFQNIAREHERKVALWFGDREFVTYGELNRLANRAARWLGSRGLAAGDVVCLSGAKSVETFALMIACLKIGAVYCVVDPDTPAERLGRIMSTCRPKLLLAEREFLASHRREAVELGIASVETDAFAAEDSRDETNLPETRRITGEHAAYIMFTSGSTGVPKGAVMTHANVLNLVGWARETYQITPDDRLTNVNPLYFDNSVFDFYASLLVGARLVPFSKAETRDPALLVDKVDGAGCTLWFSVPSLLLFLQAMKATDGVRLRSIRRFVFGGEGYPKAKLKKLYDAYAHGSEFFNVYGPTECTCICSSYKVIAEDFVDPRGLPPLGRIADNFSYLILDEVGGAVPAGESGELCLLGPNVGKGYYNDPDRTEVGFIQNPLNRHFREIMYRTGDLVSIDPADGKLYIHGRRDNQIKHMGYRIELEEIESALHGLEYVSEAAVLHANTGDSSRIVAVVASRREFEAEEIRRDLKSLIPDYMIPSVFHREAALPKNPSGKIDRRHLAEMYLGAPTMKEGACG